MDTELAKMILTVVSDAVKILGPATITAIVGYKAGKNQLSIRLEELDKNNSYKAREKIFEFHKEKLSVVDESISSLSEGLGRFAGMVMADFDDELNLSSFVSKYISGHIDGLPFQLEHVHSELKPYSGELKREYDQLVAYMKEAESISKPQTSEETHSTIVKLLEVYGFTSHCLRMLIEKEAMQIFKPYLSRT
ncbi:hypothetical protein [Shewanella algae]|uniref:hypothetical protein n=1 Tax=Shewanella algae TaxID=38313 RepID=UPI003C3D118C